MQQVLFFGINIEIKDLKEQEGFVSTTWELAEHSM